MPIYHHDELDAALARVREKVLQNQVSLGPTLTEDELRTFEEAHGVTLPEAYRRYLLEIGNGFVWEGGSPFLAFPPDVRENRLDVPFPFQEEWIWEDEDAPDETRMQSVLNGNLELIDAGCCQTYNLIVTGPCRGEVWCFAGVGIQPCCPRQDFLGWFEKWLDQGDDADYFEAYPYE